MDAVIWMTGYVGSDVEFREVRDAMVFASFRLASTPRIRQANEWVDGETTWLGVTCGGKLAENVRGSIAKGEPVIVVGRLRTNRWQDSQGISRERMTLAAVAVGHDLNRGTTGFAKNARPVTDEVQVNLGEMVMATEIQDDLADSETGAGAPELLAASSAA
ncbi:MAG TPA: single-stranded DNA-binding protein [Propionicimonas sp.]|nr:single-stranded DNA-binding protein [Propionicimonas sp.]